MQNKIDSHLNQINIFVLYYHNSHHLIEKTNQVYLNNYLKHSKNLIPDSLFQQNNINEYRPLFQVTGIIWMKDYFARKDKNSYDIDSKEPYNFDNFKLNIDSLKIIKGIYNVYNFFPLLFKEIICKFSKHQTPLFYERILYEGSEDEKKLISVIILFNDQNNKYFVVERYMLKNINWEQKESEMRVEELIKKKYNEYGKMKFLNISPYSTQPIDIQFLFLENHSYFIAELLIEYEGQPLGELIGSEKLNDELIFKIFSHLVTALNFLETHKIKFKYIKPENICIDLDHTPLKIKLMNFDKGIDEKETIDFSHKQIQRIENPINEAPEMLKIIKKDTYKMEHHLCQMYSFGITVLDMLNFFSPEIVSYNDWNKIKKYSEENYNQAIQAYFSAFSKMINEKPLFSKMFEVCKLCISYNPNERITVIKLAEVLDTFTSCSKEELIQKLETSMESIKNSKRDSILKSIAM